MKISSSRCLSRTPAGFSGPPHPVVCASSRPVQAKRLKEQGARRMSLEERKKRRRALSDLGVPDFWEFVEQRAPVALARRAAETMQINIGLYCNQACGHCHVESSPKRHETLSAADAERCEPMSHTHTRSYAKCQRTHTRRCVQLIAATPSLKTLDITGGAPELAEQVPLLVRLSRVVIKLCATVPLCRAERARDPSGARDHRPL